jgi:nitrite reductase/ring-hydroxylating ferredoxin subunit
MAPSHDPTKRRMAFVKREQFPPGSAMARATAGRDVALFNVDGRYHAIDDLCLRCSASLAAGTLEGASVRCRCGWTYDLATGEVRGIPRLGIDRYAAILDGSDVFVTIPEA